MGCTPVFPQGKEIAAICMLEKTQVSKYACPVFPRAGRNPHNYRGFTG